MFAFFIPNSNSNDHLEGFLGRRYPNMGLYQSGFRKTLFQTQPKPLQIKDFRFPYRALTETIRFHVSGWPTVEKLFAGPARCSWWFVHQLPEVLLWRDTALAQK